MGESTETLSDVENIIKILVATDIHLGYSEKDSNLGEDSFIAFEEILEKAVVNDVDFILLGGDLFHDSNPSQNSLNKCIKLLRQYTLGDKPIEIEFLSDQSLNFVEALNQTVNYEDPNLNISIPVFSIHGNHDDPSGFGGLSSLDLLSTSGLINYFGKWTNLQKIEINPIMIRKGETQLAMYGLSHIHDARLARLFHDAKVIMEKPDDTSGEWFNLMVLHQNRADRGPKNYLPESLLPEFLHFVIWGHEHDCRIREEENSERGFFVSQPGSSVATSLSEGEATEKHCGLLLVRKTQFKMQPLKLKTVRPFIYESINLEEYIDEYELNDGDAADKVMRIATTKIEEMLERAKEKETDDPRQPKLPLIRLRIFYTDENQMFSPIRFGQQYNKRIANPIDVILFKRLTRKQKFQMKGVDKSAMDNAFEQENVTIETRPEEIVDRYFDNVEDSKQLKLFPSKSLSELCRRLVENDDDDAAHNIVRFYKTAAQNFLQENFPHEDDVEHEMARFRCRGNQTYDAVLKMLDNRSDAVKKQSTKSFVIDDTNDDNQMGASDDDSFDRTTNSRSRAALQAPSVPATGRGRGRGGRGSRGGGRGRGGKKSELDVSVAKKPQSTLQDMFTSQQTTQTRGTRSKAKVVYVSDSD